METESITQSAYFSFLPFSSEIYWVLFILLLMLFFAALVSGAEVSFFTLSSSDKSFINDSKKKVYQLIRDLLSFPDKLLATILIAESFMDIGVIILTCFLINNIIIFPTPVSGIIGQVIFITIIILLFCYILPRTIASNNKIRFSRWSAFLIRIFISLFHPLSYLLIHYTLFINKKLSKYRKNLSIEDITHALEHTPDEKLPEDKGILEGIVKFGTTSVYQIMTPRIDIVAIDYEMTTEKIIEIINSSGYSRMPVYIETIDKIEGILYIKDLLPYLNSIDPVDWHDLLRQPFYVPENKKIDDLLKEFQKNKVHMAIVVDEYGGTSGIVSLEDILEEIVGDIVDEFDEEDRLYSKINDSTYLFDGKTQLNDFYRIFNLEDDLFDEIKGEADSLAGLLLEIKSDFPKLNEKISYNNVDFFVESIDNRRIKKIKVVFNRNSR